MLGRLLGVWAGVFFTTKAILISYFLKNESFLDLLSALSFISRWGMEGWDSHWGVALRLA